MRVAFAALLATGLCCAQATSPAYDFLKLAYDQLGRKEFDAAVENFHRAIKADPSHIEIHREVGYTLLKIGETEQAVEAFETYYRARPDDFNNILELGYLYYQTKQEAKALHFFRRARDAPNEQLAAQARQAFENVDGPMQAEIARWRQAAAKDPASDDARESLADAYARHGDTAAAIEQYGMLRRQAPLRYRHLATLARLFEDQDRLTANAYYLLAWRSPDPRVSALGRQGLGNRYPYGPEFEKALELEPQQNHVRKELGYLYLAIKQPEAAKRHFEILVKNDPQDAQSATQLRYLNADQPIEHIQDEIQQHRELGYASVRKSYLEAAVKEFELVYQMAPNDYQTILQLGYLYNTLKKDDVAIRWFKLVYSSQDVTLVAQARRAVANLSEPFQRVITSAWGMPFYSSRFQTAFGYGQVKSELRTASLPFRPYLSVRFVGDSRTRTGGTQPQILSDDGVVIAIGANKQLARRLWAWAEVGNAVTALNQRPIGLRRSQPDYRGGLAFDRTWGPALFQNETGRFIEATGDAVYLSRFGHNAVFYAQTKTGYNLPAFKGLHHQPFAAVNLLGDARGDFHNNALEFGPGYRLGHSSLKSVYTYVAWIHGVYTTQGRRAINFGRPNYNDLRLVLWYSRSF